MPVSYVTKHLSSFDIFQPLQNVKLILSFRAVQKRAEGQIWPEDYSLPTPDPNNIRKMVY